MEYIRNRRPDIPSKDCQRAESLVKSSQFRNWIVAPTSQKLLIHGDLQGSSRISGLSVLCLMFVKALQSSPRFTPLVFFCGRHIDEQDVSAGGRGLIRSLTAQLLCQQSFDTRLLEGTTIHNALEGNIDALCALFQSLARQVPKEVTLVCVIDGIKYFEREVYAQEMGTVVVRLLDLLQDPYMGSVVKLLVTSALETRIVRQAFAGCIISMSSAARESSGNSLALERELGGLFPTFK